MTRCTGTNCSAQLERHLEHLRLRGDGHSGLGLKDPKLMQEGFLDGVDDLYRLKDHREEMILGRAMVRLQLNIVIIH